MIQGAISHASLHCIKFLKIVFLENQVSITFHFFAILGTSMNHTF